MKNIIFSQKCLKPGLFFQAPSDKPERILTHIRIHEIYVTLFADDIFPFLVIGNLFVVRKRMISTQT